MPRLPTLCVAILFLLVNAGPAAARDNDWVAAAIARTPNDISLWTRTVPGAELKAFRGATHVAMPMPGVVAFLYDTSAMPNWIFRCREARILAEQEDGTAYVHMTIDGIWPLEDRDAVIKVVPEFVEATGELRLIGTAAPDYIPALADHIRIPSIESSWRMQPAEGGLLRIEWSGHVDPAGNVPRWLANALVTLVPRYTLKHMRDLVERDEWRRQGQLELGTRLIERSRHVSP